MGLGDVENDSTEELMEQLRKNPKKVKSFDDITQLLHVIASEQKAHNMLRSCMDKVLMNMSEIHSLRDILDRLRSVARTNGLRFNLLLDKETTGPETSCQILGDMFNVEIVLDGRDSHFSRPAVLDVKIHHSEKSRSCPELVDIISKGRFLELSKHLKKLIEMYPMSMDRQTKSRVYLALQSLEADISKMNQLYIDNHSGVDNINVIMHGLVGLLTPPSTGRSCRFIYYLTPYDLIDTATHQFNKVVDQLDSDKGLRAEVRVESYLTACNLPISPLISNNHPISGSGHPRFLDVNQHNSVPLPACFVLKLQPAVVLLQCVANSIEKETGLPVFGKDVDTQSYLSLLQNEDEEVLEVIFGQQKQRYHLDIKHMKAGLIKEIYFTHPGHIITIFTLLRKQSYLNTLFKSCIRSSKNAALTSHTSDWYFDVSLTDDISTINITFEHPFCINSTAFAEITLSSEGFQACRLFTGRGDSPLCSDQYVTTILQKSFSLPIMMRKMMIQTKRNPRKEPDRGRTTWHSFHHHPATTVLHKKPPVSSSQSQKQTASVSLATVTVTSATSSPATTNIFQEHLNANRSAYSDQRINPPDHSKKESQHPMLTNLLKPNNSVFSKSTAGGVQIKNHPNLMGLLKDTGSKTGAQQQVLQLLPTKQQQQQQQQHLQANEMTQQQALHAQSNQMQQSYVQQNQMPPPPSYHSSTQVKPQQQYQMQYQQQIAMSSQYSNQSTLNIDDLGAGSSLASPFNSQPSMSHSMTPPLVPAPSPLNSSLPSPVYPSMTSPMQPPMNTPQPISLTSPMHNAMTPPILSPAPRKMSVGRRVSRQKSQSMDLNTMDPRNDMSNIGFTSQFDMVANESDGNQSMDVFHPGMSPAQSQSFMQQQLISPGPNSSHLPLQSQYSSDRSNFSFDFDISLDNDMQQRRNSYNRHPSGQSFMTPSPAMSVGQDNPDYLSMPSPSLVNLNSNDGFQQTMFQMAETSKSSEMDATDPNYSKAAELFSPLDSNIDSKSSFPIQKQLSQSEQLDADPFSFDDNKVPQKISMPDSGSSIGSELKSRSLSRASSASSNPGIDTETTLKGLLASSPAGVSNGYQANKMSGPKVDKTVNVQSGKASTGAVQRRGSQENSSSGIRTSDSLSSLLAGGQKVSLVRQNAIKGNLPMQFQTIQREGKEKGKKQSLKEDGSRPAPKRRGRPPSTDRKEHAVKRKKLDNSSEDSETRGKIVLNVQLNKGMPISSTTKTKPVPPDSPAPDKSSSGATSSASNEGSSVDSHKLSNIPPGLQNYFKYQGELDKKKKEKKLGSGTSSPVAALSKNNGKSGSQSNAGVTGTSAIRAQLGAGKVSTSGNGKSVASAQKGSPAPTAVKGVVRQRKDSINKIADRLQSGVKSNRTSPGVSGNRGAAGSITAKAAERLSVTEQGSSVLKLKGVQLQSSKSSAGLSPKLLGGKSPAEDRSALKSPATVKQGSYNKSPSHSSKPGGAIDRTNSVTKKDKPRPVTPSRSEKVVAGSINTPPKISLASVQAQDSTKLLKTLSRIHEAAAASAHRKSSATPNSESRRMIQNRPPAKNPVQGRAITPPQNRPTFSSSSQIKPESSLQVLLKTKKSPSQAVDSNDDNPNKSSFRSTSLPRRPSSAFVPPLPKKTSNESQEFKTAPKENPRSPDDCLVIDDETNQSKQVRVRTPTPATSQPVSAVAQQSAPKPPPSYASISPLGATEFTASPKVFSPPQIDDALMDEAVL